MLRYLPFLALLAVSGCAGPDAYVGRGDERLRYNQPIKPVVAVIDFENRANFSGQWNLGSGMAELLVTELLDSGKVTVLERKHLDDVVGEIVRQGQNLFRSEGRVEPGRLKNAKFMIRGVVTDFTVTGEASGWFGVSSFAARGGGKRCRVAINVYISEVESGEIISSVKADSTVSAGGFGAGVNYKEVSFGGDAFFRTPLGRATEAAIGKAVKKILKDLPTQYWEPRVAEAGPDGVLLNGGENVGLQGGEIFAVREDGRDITDPVTGNVVDHVAGRVIGRIQVRQVNPLSALAVQLDGTARRGSLLERLP